MTDLLLFGTDGCHLCEQAQALLTELGIAYEYRDIIDNELWLKQFGLLIPVLWHQPTQRQLNWPFSDLDVRAFLA